MINLIALTAIVAVIQSSSLLPVQQKLDQLDRTFICPEDLPSDEARQSAVLLFLEQVRAIEPNLTVKSLIEYRQSLLVKHDCTKTLQYQEENLAPKGN